MRSFRATDPTTHSSNGMDRQEQLTARGRWLTSGGYFPPRRGALTTTRSGGLLLSSLTAGQGPSRVCLPRGRKSEHLPEENPEALKAGSRDGVSASRHSGRGQGRPPDPPGGRVCPAE